jgi:hypothetical protein
MKFFLLLFFLSQPLFGSVFDRIHNVPPKGPLQNMCDFLLRRSTPETAWQALMTSATRALSESTREAIKIETFVFNAIEAKYPDAVEPLNADKRLILLGALLDDTGRFGLTFPKALKNALANHNYSSFIASLKILAVQKLLEMGTIESIALAAIQLGDDNLEKEGKLGLIMDKILSLERDMIFEAAVAAEDAAESEIDKLDSELNLMGSYKNVRSRNYLKSQAVIAERKKLTKALNKIENVLDLLEKND